MSKEALEEYREILEQLRHARALTRDRLTPFEEAHFADRLQKCWNVMTESERDTVRAEQIAKIKGINDRGY